MGDLWPLQPTSSPLMTAHLHLPRRAGHGAKVAQRPRCSSQVFTVTVRRYGSNVWGMARVLPRTVGTLRARQHCIYGALIFRSFSVACACCGWDAARIWRDLRKAEDSMEQIYLCVLSSRTSHRRRVVKRFVAADGRARTGASLIRKVEQCWVARLKKSWLSVKQRRKNS